MKGSGSAFVVLLLLIAIGCGESDGSVAGLSSAPAAAGSDQSGPLKKTRWGVSRVAERNIQISAFVPYCGKPHAKPFVERVDRRRTARRVVLTMLVRYPPAKGACVGEGISVMRWIAVNGDPHDLSFFDGSTTPPTRRPLD